MTPTAARRASRPMRGLLVIENDHGLRERLWRYTYQRWVVPGATYGELPATELTVRTQTVLPVVVTVDDARGEARVEAVPCKDNHQAEPLRIAAFAINPCKDRRAIAEAVYGLLKVVL